MNWTWGNIIERFLGIFLGFLSTIAVLFFWYDNSSILKDKYFDIIIKASTSLFGFLLAILALIINSNSTAVDKMRVHGSFPRLIKYHKVSVILAFVVMLLSIFLFSIVTENNSVHFIYRFGKFTFRGLIAVQLGLSIWCAIDTILFVRIFYAIILTTEKKK